MAYLLLIVLFLASLIASDAVSKDANGYLVYEGTRVVQVSPAAPTLVYNCAKMPSICQNVAAVNQMNSDKTLQTAPVIFHYDPNGIRKAKRRSNMCPPKGLDDWYDHHACPEQNKQPPVVVAGGWVDINGQPHGEAFWGVPFPDSFQLGRASNNLIGRTLTDYRGMYWSCDEWPAASWVEGGNPNSGNTYCAPMDQKCGGMKKNYPNIPNERSEQDYQAAVHGALAGLIKGQKKILEFHFRTEFDDRADPNGVLWHSKLIAFVKREGRIITRSYTRRGIEEESLDFEEGITEFIYPNGSHVVRRPLAKRDLPAPATRVAHPSFSYVVPNALGSTITEAPAAYATVTVTPGDRRDINTFIPPVSDDSADDWDLEEHEICEWYE